jgi:CBS domain-containing protein
MAGEDHKSVKLVRDLMTVGVETCGTDVIVIDLVHLILGKDLEGVVVLNDEGHAVGVVTISDLVRAYSLKGYLEKTAEEIMTPGVLQVPPDIPVTAAAQMMQDNHTRVAFLMHHAGGVEYPAAKLTYKHFLRHMAADEWDELSDLGIHADREAPLETYLKRREKARRENIPNEKRKA